MRLALALLLSAVSLAKGEEAGRWKLQYFYDESHSSFTISDLKFPSPTHGMATGWITSPKGVKPSSAVTTDGGAHWTLLPQKEAGESLYFLNDSLGWMVTTKGLWQTEEFGKSWRKLKAPAGLLRVHFVDPNHGWAVGVKKQIYETKNGGADWTEIPEVEKVKTSEDHTVFAWIEFADKDTGMIGGWSKPPRRDQPSQQRVPDWLDPESASYRQEWPHLGILLDTRDGGKDWTPSTMSLFGEITTVKLSPEGWSNSPTRSTGRRRSSF